MIASPARLAGLVTVAAFALGLSGAQAQSTDALYQAAKKEGSVVWYTTFPLDEAAPLGEAFSKKYPGMKVDIVRGSGTRIVERFETEYRAKRQGADVITGALLDPHEQWKKNGWLLMWWILVGIGILSTFGPTPGSIEGMVYTTFPIRSQLNGWVEVVPQAFLLSAILCYWVKHPEKRWLNWTLSVLCILLLLMVILGLVVANPAKP